MRRGGRCGRWDGGTGTGRWGHSLPSQQLCSARASLPSSDCRWSQGLPAPLPRPTAGGAAGMPWVLPSALNGGSAAPPAAPSPARRDAAPPSPRRSARCPPGCSPCCPPGLGSAPRQGDAVLSAPPRCVSWPRSLRSPFSLCRSGRKAFGLRERGPSELSFVLSLLGWKLGGPEWGRPILRAGRVRWGRGG